MITFTCNKAALMRLVLVLGVSLNAINSKRPRYFELCKNGKVLGYWNEISGAGELTPALLAEPLEKLIAINK